MNFRGLLLKPQPFPPSLAFLAHRSRSQAIGKKINNRNWRTRFNLARYLRKTEISYTNRKSKQSLCSARCLSLILCALFPPPRKSRFTPFMRFDNFTDNNIKTIYQQLVGKIFTLFSALRSKKCSKIFSSLFFFWRLISVYFRKYNIYHVKTISMTMKSECDSIVE